MQVKGALAWTMLGAMKKVSERDIRGPSEDSNQNLIPKGRFSRCKAELYAWLLTIWDTLRLQSLSACTFLSISGA